MKDRLKDIKIENFVWLVYIFIIILSYCANYKKNFILYNDEKSKREYQNLLILIFSILLIIYIYFAYSSYEDIKELKYYNTYNDDFVESQNQNYKLKKNYKRIHRVPYILFYTLFNSITYF